jgi:hypothetical protein
MAIHFKYRVTDAIIGWGTQQLIIYHAVSTNFTHIDLFSLFGRQLKKICPTMPGNNL